MNESPKYGDDVLFREIGKHVHALPIAPVIHEISISDFRSWEGEMKTAQKDEMASMVWTA